MTARALLFSQLGQGLSYSGWAGVAGVVLRGLDFVGEAPGEGSEFGEALNGSPSGSASPSGGAHARQRSAHPPPMPPEAHQNRRGKTR